MEKRDFRVQEIVKELLGLAEVGHPSSEIVGKVKGLMRELRKMGYTNEEVSGLTGQRWKESTVKLYTKGTKVGNPGPKREVTELLQTLIGRGMTLEQVEHAISLEKGLDSKQVGMEELASFLSEIKSTGTDLKGFLAIHGELRNSGLTVEQLKQLLSYQSALQQMGITSDGLKAISETSKQYGGYEKVLQAVKAHDSLESLNHEVTSRETRKSNLDNEIANLTRKVEGLSDSKRQIEDALNTYEKLKLVGFDEKVLTELKSSSDKYGGVKGVVEAINSYAMLRDLQQNISDLEREKGNLEADYKKAEADHAHLKTLIEMCDALLDKHKFSLPAIMGIYESAKKYGEPFEVLKAIDAYGQLKALEAETKRLSARRDELQKSATELQRDIQNQRATIESVVELREKHGIGADEILNIRSVAEKYGPPASILHALDTYKSLKDIGKQKAAFDASVEELTQREASLRGRIATIEETLTALPGKADKSVEGVKSSLEEFSEQVRRLGGTVAEASKDVADLKERALAAGREMAAAESRAKAYEVTSKLTTFLVDGRGEEVEVVEVAVAFLNRLSEWAKAQTKYMEIGKQFETLKVEMEKRLILGQDK
jgi:predicted  nucleic acid-binding Zn-ribbon protein